MSNVNGCIPMNASVFFLYFFSRIHCVNSLIAKTIIFSSSHVEAEKIVERFYGLYPYLSSDFCKLIDSKVENNLSLIDNFGERDHMPQVAVSVDMLDTGIDVPDILNLVFFKSVNSKIKFLQMIGRGTRLSSDISEQRIYGKQ